MKRGAPLKRSTPLRRKTRLRARGNTSYARRPRDFVYMGKVARLPCVVRKWPGAFVTTCAGRVQVDHAGDRPFHRRAPDDTSIPICTKHHGERTDYRGTFKGFDAGLMRAFCDWAIKQTQKEVAYGE